MFRILLFKLFNQIETWELLEQSLGPLTYAEYSFKRYDQVLSRAMAQGQKIYSAAYIMPSGGSLGHEQKHRNHLTLIERMIAGELARPAGGCEDRCSEAFDLIRGLSDDRRLPGLPVRHRHQLQRGHELHGDGVRRPRSRVRSTASASASPTRPA